MGDSNGTVEVASAIPQELRERPQWLVWRLDPERGKIPYQARRLSQMARANDPTTWATYDEAVDKMAAANAPSATRLVKPVDGIGFVPTKDDPFTFIDLDGCVVDGEIVPDAQQIIDSLPGYWETSPSGTGIRGVVLGSLPVDAGNVGKAAWKEHGPHAKAQIEAYDQGHYFAMTGNGSGAISECQDALEAFARQHLPRREDDRMEFDWDHEPAAGERFEGTTDELIAALSEDDPHFVELFNGETVPAGKDGDSDADFALCCRVAEFVGNHPRLIESVWVASKLAERAKFERESYRTRTVKNAVTAVLGERRGDANPIDSQGSPCRSDETYIADAGGDKDPRAASTEDDPPVWEKKLAGRDIGRTARTLRNSPTSVTEWRVPGVAALGWTVLFGGREKIAGKGTLLSYLISRLERGEATVFGAAAPEPITTLIYTEETGDSLAEKHDHFGIEKAYVVFTWELSDLTWNQQCEWLISTALEQDHKIIYVDNIARAAGVKTEDESGLGLAKAIDPLSKAAKEHGLTVFLDHHNRKSGGKTEDLLRGGTALPGACENIIAIDRSGDWTTRKRKLYSRGRVKATLWERTIELSEDGTEYTESRGDFRLRALSTQDEWTVLAFATALGKSDTVARKYLNNSEYVERIDDAARGGKGGGSTATVYRLKDRAALLQELDSDGEPQI